MPEMRDDSGAEDSRHGRRRAKGNSLVIARVLDRASADHSGASHRDGTCDSGAAYRFDYPEADWEMDRVRPNDAGGPLGGRLFFTWRLAGDGESYRNLVNLNRHRVRRAYFLQPCAWDRAG